MQSPPPPANTGNAPAPQPGDPNAAAQGVAPGTAPPTNGTPTSYGALGAAFAQPAQPTAMEMYGPAAMRPEPFAQSAEQFDLKPLLFKLLRHWYLFLISVPLCLTAALLYNWYATPIYSINATVLVRDEKNQSMGAENALDALAIFKQKKNLQNEVGILQSFTLIHKVVDALPLRVNYFQVGDIKQTQVYKTAPFTVELDSVLRNTLIYGHPFSVTLLSKGRFKIEFISDDKKISKNGVNYSRTFRFGDSVTHHRLFKLRLMPSANYNPQTAPGTRWQFTLANPESVTRSFQNQVSVRQVQEDASILALSINDALPARGSDFINTLAGEYIREGVFEKNQIAVNTINFIQSELSEVADSLGDAERTLERFKTQNRLVDVPLQTNQILERLQQLEGERAIDLKRQNYYQDLEDYINSPSGSMAEITSPSAVGISDPSLNQLIVDLVGARNMRRTELEGNLTLDNPVIKRLDAQIAGYQRSLQENLRNLARNGRASLNTSANTIRMLERELQGMPKKEIDLVRVKRSFNLNEQIYIYLVTKLADAEIARASNVADNRLLDVAAVKGPISPVKSRNIAIALFMGLIVPAAFVLLRDFFNDRVRTRQEVERITNIPILGIVGHSSKENNLAVDQSPKSAVAEAFRSIRTNMEFIAPSNRSRVINITSSISGEGKTFTAINIATVLANSGKRTVLLGLDLRKPKIFQDFKLSNSRGMSTYLIGQDAPADVVQSTSVENLDFIAAGPVPPNPSELIMGDRFPQLIQYLRERYDNVVIDTPPLGLVTDALLLMSHADINIYIVRQNYTPRGLLQYVSDLYSDGKIRNLSIVMNDVKAGGGAYGYGYGAGYGYGYGYGAGYGYGYGAGGGYYEETTHAAPQKGALARLWPFGRKA